MCITSKSLVAMFVSLSLVESSISNSDSKRHFCKALQSLFIIGVGLEKNKTTTLKPSSSKLSTCHGWKSLFWVRKNIFLMPKKMSSQQSSGRFVGIITSWDPSVCKSNRLHVDMLWFSFIKLGYILYIPLKWSVIFCSLQRPPVSSQTQPVHL